MAKSKRPGANGLEWKKSGAHTMSIMAGGKGMPSDRNWINTSPGKMSTKHGTNSGDMHKSLHHAESCLGSHTRTFKKGLPEAAPCNFKGSGAHKSKELK